MREIIKEVINEFHEQGLPKFFRREVKLDEYIKTKIAVVIIGPRRAGKTYLMYQIMDETGLDIKDYLYINFEDNRLAEFKQKNFEDILRAYYELYPNKKPIIFLDEVHVVDGWEYFVRRLVDKGYKVYITGSNSKLLSKEYSTHIGGRFLELLVLPFSFLEFLKVKKIDWNKNILYSKKRFEILKLLKEYIEFGGFPDVVLSNKELKKKVLQAYFNTVVYKDIVARCGIENPQALLIFIKKIAENITKPYSFASIEKIMNKIGLKTTRKTLINYLKYMEESFFAFSAYQLKQSFLRRERERKTYIIDNGYLNLFFTKTDMGRCMENIFAQEIFKKGKVYYFKGKKEVDFIINKKPVQICYDLTNTETFEREMRSLISYLKYKGEKKGYIITWNDHRIIKKHGFEIYILPLYYVLLYGLETKT